ncbi:MAG: ParA family protein [Spirochaetia bacterium]
MKVIALYNMKGGVGKTTAAVNLAFVSANSGYSTLLCDLDPQGSASYYFRLDDGSITAEKLVKGGKKIGKKIKSSGYDNIDVLPSDFSYKDLPLLLDDKKHPKRRLKDTLSRFESDYKIIFLDCPPNIGLESENIFKSADYILVPVIPSPLSFLSTDKLLDYLNDKKFRNDRVIPFCSMVDSRKKIHKDFQLQASEKYPNCFTAAIPYASDIEQSALTRKPICAASSSTRGAQSFRALWKELEERINLKSRDIP